MKQTCINCTNEAKHIYKDIPYCDPCLLAIQHRPTTMIEFKRNRNIAGRIV